MTSPLESWLDQHIPAMSRLRGTPSFHRHLTHGELWARLIAQSDRLEYEPEIVPAKNTHGAAAPAVKNATSHG